MPKQIDPEECKTNCPVYEACYAPGDPNVCDATIGATHQALGAAAMGGRFARLGRYGPDAIEALKGLGEALVRRGHRAEDVEYPGSLLVPSAEPPES